MADVARPPHGETKMSTGHSNDRLLEGYINPLAFHEVEEPWTTLHPDKPVKCDDVLQYLVDPRSDCSVDAIVSRYLEISKENGNRIVAAPKGVLEMLIWPLRYAKGSYALANYLGSLALCGTACEMGAIFIYEAYVAFLAHEGRYLNRKSKYAKPQSFVGAKQFERVLFLLDLKLITPAVKDDFDIVRLARNRHLHLQPALRETIAQDAARAFLAAIRAIKHVLGFDIRDGKIVLRPEVYAWLDAHPERVSAD
jgi:hypothetical protein